MNWKRLDIKGFLTETSRKIPPTDARWSQLRVKIPPTGTRWRRRRVNGRQFSSSTARLSKPDVSDHRKERPSNLLPATFRSSWRQQGLDGGRSGSSKSGLDKSVYQQYESSLTFPRATCQVKDLKVAQGNPKQTLHGYVGNKKLLSAKLAFVDLVSTDLSSSVQVVCSSKAKDGTSLASLPQHTPVSVTGFAKGKAAPKGGHGETIEQPVRLAEVELELESYIELNPFPRDLMLTSDTVFDPSKRNLEIRASTSLRRALRLRSQVATAIRNLMVQNGFVEVETPLLFKSTPEGAREFLVPTRQPGKAYALPQSPQQYKQILMTTGVGKYFQIAKCFRDEDLRADRQPEFTQVDLEIPFASEADVIEVTEQLVKTAFTECGHSMSSGPFSHLTYSEAMTRFGSDKPDLRFGEIIDLTSVAQAQHDGLPSGEQVVQAVKFTPERVPSPENTSAISYSSYEWSKPILGPGEICAVGKFDSESGITFNPKHPAPNVSLSAIAKAMGLRDGDTLMIHIGPKEPLSGGWTTMGKLRLAFFESAVRHGLTKPLPGFHFLWVTDFPLFSPAEADAPGQSSTIGLAATHHPFTAPKTPSDLALLQMEPLKAIAAHYDIVVNGVEIGGGSRRIHNADVQEYIFREILKMPSDRVEDFRHLLDALKTGCPPHAGLALGFDRLMALALGHKSVRDVIAFPKNNRGEDPMVGSPNQIAARPGELV